MTAEHAHVRADRPALLDRLVRPDGSRPHAVIEASAGTGKTHTLEHLVIDLLLAGTPIERILVVTFTEKATLEMRARIRARIAALVAAGHTNLRAALVDFDRAPISTIHAFCQRVLAEQAFVSGRLLEQQRLDPREAFARTFREALRRGLSPSASERPLLEVALRTLGATKLEELLFRWSHEHGEVRPKFDGEQLASALVAMPERDELEGPEGRALFAAVTHHDVRARLRTALEDLAPLVARARAGEATSSWLPDLFAWSHAQAHRGTETRAEYVATKLAAHPLLAAPSRAIAEHGASALPALLGLVLPAIRARLDDEKRRLGRFDFDDMLRLVHGGIHGAAGEQLVAALRARYRYALVDEFQDTDPVQWAIFRRVFTGRDDGGALVLIGDPKQSIYAFRSADVHTYLAACREVVDGGGVQVPLVDCYRSTRGMIDAVNAILQDGFFTGINAYPNPVRCGRPELRATASDGTDVAPVELLHLVGKEKLRAKPMRFALAEAIADEIERIVGGGLRVTDRERPGELRVLRHSDVYVLTRTTKEAMEVAEALARRGVPHALAGQEGIFETRQALDVLDVLRALEDPSDRALRLRAWLTPFFAAAPSELDACRALPVEHPFVERLARWSALAREHRFAALFHAMMDESGLSRRLLFLREGERELVNYQHVLELLLARAGKGRLGLRELTTALATLVDQRRAVAGDDEDVQRLESDRAAVQLLTMHKSKGLEAEVVFLFGGMTPGPARPLEPHVLHEDGRRVAWVGEPDAERKERVREEEREEFERLLYVALTRARSRLYLPYVGPAPAEEPLPPGTVSELARNEGAYRVLGDRLTALVTSGEARTLFARRVVMVKGARRRFSLPLALPQLGLGEGERALTVAPLMPPDRFDRLRASARGVEITSYTRMKAGRTKLDARTGALDETSWQDEFVREPGSLPAPDDDPLPGGAAFGVFVHEVLEHLDRNVARSADDGAALLAHEDTARLFRSAAERNGVDLRVLPPTAQLVWTTLRTPLRIGELVLPEGFASLPSAVAELSFLHPIPEPEHPPFGTWQSPGDPPLATPRGFVRGVMDLVFRHEGRLWVVDWKTDRLPSYDASALAAHVEVHYEVQARLYALAAARMLRLTSVEDHDARFGGVVYVFVRGLRGRDKRRSAGVTLARPSFRTLAEWDRALRESDAPWGHPLPPRPGTPPDAAVLPGSEWSLDVPPIDAPRPDAPPSDAPGGEGAS